MSRTVIFVLMIILILLSFAGGYWLGLQDGRKQIIDEIHQGVPDYKDAPKKQQQLEEIS